MSGTRLPRPRESRGHAARLASFVSLLLVVVLICGVAYGCTQALYAYRPGCAPNNPANR